MATTDPQKISTVPQQVEIEAYQGDTLSIKVVITDDVTGDPVDISADDVKFTIKRLDGTSVLALFVGAGVTLTDPTNGEATITVTSVQATNMPADVLMAHDIQWEQSGGTVTTVARGAITFKPQITA